MFRYVADTFNEPEHGKLVPDGRKDPKPPCNCHELGGARRGNHHPNCNIRVGRGDG